MRTVPPIYLETSGRPPRTIALSRVDRAAPVFALWVRNEETFEQQSTFLTPAQARQLADELRLRADTLDPAGAGS